MAHDSAAAPVKVVALCGSLRKGSWNRGLIRAAIELSKGAIEGMEIEEVDIAPLPMLNTDLEEDGKFPLEVEAFRKKILEADSVLFASPEYNYSVSECTGLGIEATECVGRQSGGDCECRRVVGGGRGQTHLRDIGVFLDLHFVNKPEFYLNAFEPPPKFNPLNGDLIDEDVMLRLKQMLLSLKAFTLQLRSSNN